VYVRRLTPGYQGHTKLSPPEPNYSGDWGDWIAFTEHMKRRAHAQGADLLLVDTGDLRTYTPLMQTMATACVMPSRAATPRTAILSRGTSATRCLRSPSMTC